MKKRMVYLNITLVILLILSSLTSVIGFSLSQSQNQEYTSPLFVVRIKQSINESIQMNIHSKYLGEEKNPIIFPASQLSFQSQLNKVIKIIFNNPSFVKKLFEKISDSSKIKRIINKYGLNLVKIEQYISQLKDHPEILKEELKNIDCSLLKSDLKPMDLSTSSVIGCFIVVLALLPLAVIIGIIISTITIVTCLNIGNCAETIITDILNSIVQELKQQ